MMPPNWEISKAKTAQVKYLEKKIAAFPQFYTRCKDCKFIYRIRTYSSCPQCNDVKEVRIYRQQEYTNGPHRQ